MQRLTGPEFISYTGTVSGYTTSNFLLLWTRLSLRIPDLETKCQASCRCLPICLPVPFHSQYQKKKRKWICFIITGNVYELEKEKDLSVSGDIKETLYWGDILTSIRFS